MFIPVFAPWTSGNISIALAMYHPPEETVFLQRLHSTYILFVRRSKERLFHICVFRNKIVPSDMRASGIHEKNTRGEVE